jgi:hypothetical protein
LSAPQCRRLLEELEKLEDDALDREDHDKAWAEWVDHGPQGPIDSDEP